MTGTGGVGKTQLAVEFCYRYGRFFHGVHWLHADQDMLAEIAACGTEMDLQPWPDTLPEQAQATLEAWERGGTRLVVLDDVVDIEVVQVWLPKLTRARLLVTSRRGEWPPDLGLTLLPVVTMPRPESRALLRRLAPRLDKNSDSELDKIADRLGDLPLALDLAGRYLSDRRGLSLAGFLTELDQAGGALQHSALKDWTAHNPTQHDTNLAASFTLSWNRLASSGETSAFQSQAQRMFCAAGYCAASTPIPWQVFYRLEGAADGKAQAAVDKALGTLEDGGLISLGETGALIQRLLAEFARLQDGAGEASALPRLAQTLGELAYEANESGLPEQFKPLRAHVEISCGWAEAAELEQAGTLWSNLGTHLQVVAEYSGAKAAFERALRISEAAFGPDHPTVAIRVNNLGKLLVALGEYTEAKAAFDRALAIRKEKLGNNDPDTATTLNDLGYMYQDLGDYDSARSYFEQALSVYEHALGEQHPWVATAANNLGSVLHDLGDLAGAKAAYERALAIDEAAFGPDHPKVAIRINNLGGVLHALGDDVEAQSAFERALAIDEQTFGPDHPDVARDLNNLGSVLRARDDLAGAKAAYERALHIDEAAFGPEHPNVAIHLSNLGNVLQDMGDLAGARAADERALAIDEATFGPEHPNVAIRVNNLGRVLQALGDSPGQRLPSSGRWQSLRNTCRRSTPIFRLCARTWRAFRARIEEVFCIQYPDRNLLGSFCLDGKCCGLGGQTPLQQGYNSHNKQHDASVNKVKAAPAQAF